MKIIKRDGHMVEYCPEKIEQAISKANNDVCEEEKASPVQIKNIIKYIEGLQQEKNKYHILTPTCIYGI